MADPVHIDDDLQKAADAIAPKKAAGGARPAKKAAPALAKAPSPPAPAKVQASPAHLMGLLEGVRQKAQAVPGLLSPIGAAALALDVPGVRSRGMAVVTHWRSLALAADSAKTAYEALARQPPAVDDPAHAEHTSAVAAYGKLPSLLAATRLQLGRCGLRAIPDVEVGTRRPAVPEDPIPFLLAQIEATQASAVRAKDLVMMTAGKGGLHEIGHLAFQSTMKNAQDKAEYKYFENVLRANGFDWDAQKDNMDGIHAHRDELRSENRIGSIASSQGLELDKKKIDELQTIAKAVRKDPDTAKDKIRATSGAEREALIVALDEDGVLNNLLATKDPELLELIRGTRAGKRSDHVDGLEDKDWSVWGAVSSADFWATGAKLLPGRVTQAASGLVKSAGDIPIIGKAISPVTNAASGLIDKGTKALDGATGADAVWDRNPEAKAVSDGLANTSGALVLNAMTGRAAASLGTAGTVFNTGAQIYGKVDKAMDFLDKVDDLAEKYEKVKHVWNGVLNSLLPLGKAILDAAEGDQNRGVAAISTIFDGAIGACAAYLGEKMTPGKTAADAKESADARQARRQDRAARRAGPGETSLDDKATVSEEQVHKQNVAERAGAPDAPKLNAAGWSGFADVLIREMVSALKEILLGMKNALLAGPLGGKKKPADLQHAFVKEVAATSANIAINIGETAIDALIDKVTKRLDQSWITPWKLSHAVPVPSSVYLPRIKSVLKTGAKQIFAWLKPKLQDAILSGISSGEPAKAKPALPAAKPLPPTAHPPAGGPAAT